MLFCWKEISSHPVQLGTQQVSSMALMLFTDYGIRESTNGMFINRSDQYIWEFVRDIDIYAKVYKRIIFQNITRGNKYGYRIHANRFY